MKESSYLRGREDLVEKFLKMRFMQRFGREYINQILYFSKLRKYDVDEVIISEGATDRWVYVLLSGKVKVAKHEKEIAMIDKIGDIFGELAIIDKSPRSASVRAIEETVCLAFDAGVLDDVKPQDPAGFYLILYRVLAEVLAQRLRTTDELLTRALEGRDLMETFMKNKWYQDR